MQTTKEVNSFLEDYFYTLSDREKSEFASKGYDVWSLGRNKDVTERLINLILKGRKRATSSLYTKKRLPDIGSYGIILDHQDSPRCLVKYTGFDIKPFSKVDREFAEEEGEGSGDIEDWAEEHRQHFKEASPRFNDTSLILFEKFRLVFKSA